MGRGRHGGVVWVVLTWVARSVEEILHHRLGQMKWQSVHEI